MEPNPLASVGEGFGYWKRFEMYKKFWNHPDTATLFGSNTTAI